MTGVEMYKVTRKGKFVGAIRKSDLTTHGDLLVRAKYELAQMVGGQLAKSILRGRASLFSDGTIIIGPCDSKGHCSIDGRCGVVSFIFTPYVFSTDDNPVVNALRYYTTGAIERGEAEAIEEQKA